MKPLRIAFFSDTFLPQMNGVVTSLLNLSEGLCKRGHSILIIAPKTPHQTESKLKNNIQVTYVKSKKLFFYPEFRISNPFTKKVVGKIKQFKPDIIHFHTQLTLGLSAIIIAKRLHIPLVGTFHTLIADPKYLKHVHLGSFGIAEKIGWKYSNFFYKRSDAIVCPSRNVALELRSVGIKKRINVIPNPIKIKEMVKKKSKDRNIKMVNKKYCNLLFIGRMSHEKSIDILLKSLKIALSKDPNITLTLIGKGPSLKQLKSFTKKLDISEKVTFLGQIDNKVLMKKGILGFFDVFTTVSTTENQPMTILEAMAYGLPIIGVNERGIAELVTHRKNGLLVPKDNPEAFARAILYLSQNRELRQKFGRESRKKSKQYDYQKIAEHWEQFYVGLIGKKK